MKRPDERRAFEAMLAEISDSDSDDGRPHSKPTVSNSPAPQVAPSKPTPSSPLPSKPSSAPLPEQKKSGTVVTSKRMSAEELAIENFGSSFTKVDAAAEQTAMTKRWLSRPAGRGDRQSMQCFIERERSTLGLSTVYRAYLEPSSESQLPRFMMSAKKKVNKQTSYYLLSIDEDPSDDRGSETVLGKVRGNAIGSRYIITDHGLAPDKTVAPSMLRAEHGLVSFEFDSGGPSRIEVWIPSVSASGAQTIWRPTNDQESMDTKINEGKTEGISYLRNKMPKWDEAHGGHVLNFQGRVTMSSVKNFQLYCADDGEDVDEVVLQFGRVGKHKFTMDLKFPLSPLQAFGICVACLDGKLADRKGYEYFKMLTGGSTSGNSAPPSSAADAKDNGQSKAVTNGSMKGQSGFSNMLPSSQYMRDKWNRSFK